MAIVNHETREVAFKLVFCGTPMSGKTTNLQYIHRRTEPTQRGDLVSLATMSDRTLFFDFLPINTMVINGYKTRFQLYTVPGQVHYNASRQMVLRGVDGIIFVADSQSERMEENLTSWHGTVANLEANGTPLGTIPAILQYNKRDTASAAPVNYMEFVLNNRPQRLLSFEACANTGAGVFVTLNALAQLVLQRFHNIRGSSPSPASPDIHSAPQAVA